MLDSNGSFDNPFFQDKKIVKIDCKWKGQEYSKDAFGFTHAEYVCSFILKENPEAEIVLVPIVRKNKKSTVLDMIEGIELLIEEQVDIINMSMGDEYKYHKEIEEVCRAATEKGILIVAAYSNQQVEATYPASFPFVMGIRCLDIENPLQVFQYDGIGKDVIFSSKFFSLYHLGIPKFYQGNSFGCAVITGYLSNYEDEYEQAILQFTLNTLNHYYPYQTLKQKVFGLYKAHIQKNQEVIFWNLWEQYLKSFLIPCPFYACKAGLTTCYVTTDGGIYTCAELPEFKIGSVEAGLDVPRIREIIYLEDQEDTMCKKCQYIRHCKTRGCQVANYEIHQNVYQPIKVNCEVTKWMYHLIQTNLTEKQLEKLKQEYERRYLRHGK